MDSGLQRLRIVGNVEIDEMVGLGAEKGSQRQRGAGMRHRGGNSFGGDAIDVGVSFVAPAQGTVTVKKNEADQPSKRTFSCIPYNPETP